METVAGVFGAGAPAFGQGTVVAGFSSGELNAYRYENGRLVWQDQLQRTSIRTSVASISDVDASPVIDNGQVIAVGQTTMTTATTTTAEGAQTTESLPLTLFTLAVNQKEAEKVMFAATHGEISFGLLNDESKVKNGPGVTQQNLFG